MGKKIFTRLTWEERHPSNYLLNRDVLDELHKNTAEMLKHQEELKKAKKEGYEQAKKDKDNKMELNNDLKNLEKICGSGFGQRFLEDVGRICVNILKQGYKADSTLTAIETDGYEFTKPAQLDSDSLETYVAYSLLTKKGLIKPYDSHSRTGYTITESGKTTVNKYFRKKGETFGVIDVLYQYVAEHKKKMR